MAQIDRFMIAPITDGIRLDLKPWMIPDDAFEILLNCYQFRGRVRKRFGAFSMNPSVPFSVATNYSRLRMSIGTTLGPLNIPGTATQLQIGQMFSINDDMFTIYQLGAGVLTLSTNAGATATINSTTNPNTVTFTGYVGVFTVYYYPSTPVMGFVTYEDDMINNEPVYAFDTQFAYKYTTGITAAWSRLSGEAALSPGSSVWTGSDSQFFWGSTYRGVSNADYYLFVTNFNFPTTTPSSSAYDYQRYYDGTNWNYLYPIVSPMNRLITSRMILPFKDRLICLNTVELNEGTIIGQTSVTTGNFSGNVGAYSFINGQQFLVGTTVYTVISNAAGPQAMAVVTINTNVTQPTATFDVSTGNVVITGNGNNASTAQISVNVVWFANSNPTTGNIIQYVNRCRYSQNGSPVQANAWVETIGGKGGYIDAPTKEQIVTSEFLKDRLIVYFEKSTWELVYTGNEILPFRWQQINTELGAESTFSSVPFDKVVLGIGNTGIHACNGSNVERIDNKIPDEVFAIENNNQGVFRVYGIRDYYVEQVYWTFPSDDKGATYPNTVLVYNYKNGNWALNTDSFTAFGYYQSQPSATWANTIQPWQDLYAYWDSGVFQSHFRQVIAGNQEGFTCILAPDYTKNAPMLQVTNITVVGDIVTIKCINHNLVVGGNVGDDYIYIQNQNGITGLDDIHPLESVTDANTFTLIVAGVAGTYLGGGVITRISNVQIKTKQYNFYVQDGVNSFINKVDFLVDKTPLTEENLPTGGITVDYNVSSSNVSMVEDGEASGALLGTGILDTAPYILIPLEKTQERLWHPIYPMAEGECIQLVMYYTDEQMRDLNVVFEDFQLHAMCFYTSRTGRLQ